MSPALVSEYQLYLLQKVFLGNKLCEPAKLAEMSEEDSEDS